METQAEFAERWIAEYRVRTARTADWLLNHLEITPRKNQETFKQKQANVIKNEIASAQKYEINWNHPRMREALRLYYYNNLRFDDKINLDQNAAPDNIDINPDFWNDVSQILKQLKIRDLSTNFGLAKYCPQFSSNGIDNVISTYYHSNQSACGSIDQSPTSSTKDIRRKEPISLPVIDRVTSPNGLDNLPACGSLEQTPTFIYNHMGVQCGSGEDGNQTTEFNRVMSCPAMDFQNEFYHGYTRGIHRTQPSTSNVGAVTYYNVKDSQTAYYNEFARGMYHKHLNDTPTERVTSPDVTDSQAVFYQGYARRLFPSQSSATDLDTVISPNLTDSPAAVYQKFARGMYGEQSRASSIARLTSPGIQDSQASYYHEYAKSMHQKPSTETFGHGEDDTNKSKSCHHQELSHNGPSAQGFSLIHQNPLLRHLARARNIVMFKTPSMCMYIQTSQEIAWKKIRLKTNLVMVSGKMIRDFSLREIKRKYKSYNDGEGSLESLDVGLRVGLNQGSHIKEYSRQSHESASVKYSTFAAVREKLLKKNDKSIPNISNNTKTSAGSLCSEDSLQEAIREILSEDDLSKQCTLHIRKDEKKVLEDVSPKAVCNNDKDKDSKSKDVPEYTKKDKLDIARGDRQSQQQYLIQEHVESIREKANATLQARRKEVVNLQLPDNDIREQSGTVCTVCTNTLSSSTSLWSAGQFYTSAVSQEQEELGCELNVKLTPPQATKKICPMACHLLIPSHPIGQTSPCHKTTNNPDERIHGSHLLDPNSDDREPSANAPITELKPRQRNKLLQFIQRKAALLRSKISSLSCRSSTLNNK